MIENEMYSFAFADCIVFDLECFLDRWCVGFHGRGRNGEMMTRLVDGDRDSLARLLDCFATHGRILIGYNSSRFEEP
jgi:hypothetical protein